MPTLYGDAIRQGLEEERQRQKAAAEAAAKAHTFNIGSLLPALIAAPFTGGASLVSMGIPAATGEAVRAMTGSDTDYGALASAAYNMFGPTTSARVNPTAESLKSTAAQNAATTGSMSRLAPPPVANPQWIQKGAGNMGGWLQDASVAPKSKAQIAMDALKGTMVPSGFTDPTTQIKWDAPDKTTQFTPDTFAKMFQPLSGDLDPGEQPGPGVVAAPAFMKAIFPNVKYYKWVQAPSLEDILYGRRK